MRKLLGIFIVFILFIAEAKGAKYQEIILKLVNEARIENGLTPLKINEELNNIAIMKAKDMAEEEILSHNSKRYGMTFNIIKEKGIKFSAAGENIARWHDTPEFVVERWLNSKGHRDNILNPNYDETGIGMAKDKDGKNYWVELFIKKKN